MRQRTRRVLASALSAVLAGCGGGGGGAYDGGSGGGGGGSGGGDAPLAGVDLGENASFHGARMLPDDNPWNARVDALPLDPSSDALIDTIGRQTSLHPDFGADWDGGPFGIPYVVVDGTTPRVPVAFDTAGESDPGPYPIPSNAPIEGGAASSGDRHVLVLHRDEGRLYETWSTYPDGGGGWTAGSGAVFDLSTNALRPAGWTSADAAGLPVLPGLVRWDEVNEPSPGAGEIRHALRFTASLTRRAYVAPATHWASSSTDPARPPMGMRVRLKASVDPAAFPPMAAVVVRALQRYGMFLADNGGDWCLSGAPDARWDDADLSALKSLVGEDFEVVAMGPLTTP